MAPVARAITSCAPWRRACAAWGPITWTSTNCTGGTARPPSEETLSTLDGLVPAGKVRYIGCSNYSAWHLMKSLAAADRAGLEPSSVTRSTGPSSGRDVETEIVPAAVDQGLGILVWSPLAGGLLTGKYRRGAKPGGALAS